MAVKPMRRNSPDQLNGRDNIERDGTVTNTHRQKVGDLYDPGHGRRVQIRDTSRRIIGYIERDGTVTNTHRQKVGTLDW
jgi:hypothetical protein